MKIHTHVAAFLIGLALCGADVVSQPVFTSGMYGGMRARALGPAVMSGRISDLAVTTQRPNTVWVGAAGGGVWKSTNSGTTFTPVFDDYAQSIGAITIDQQRPDTVWVGTGESWTRNSVSIGDGVYRTTDGGTSWVNVGLPRSERIGMITIDPKRPQRVFVAVTGALFSDSEERGLYRTTDFGQTWSRVLFTNARSGATDVIVDPKNPNIVWASMWEFRRTPYSFSSGGPGSGLFRSTDGGTTWSRVTSGFPTGDLGRIAIAMSPSKPSVMYANVESKETALYRSSDGGKTWQRRFDGMASSLRPFYFSRLVVDPLDPDVVYKCGLNAFRSDDGGMTFTTIMSAAHSDHHAIWIDPLDTNRVFTATDGGLYTSDDRGKSCRFVSNLPLSQFYHVSVDDAMPYNVYGGLQDNGSWRGPSTTTSGVRSKDWLFVGGGDGFHVVRDGSDPNTIYWESQGGNIVRTNLFTEESFSIRPEAESGSPKLRWNWNTPIVRSSSRKDVLYVGSQFLHRTTNGGRVWQKISPDLTTNDSIKQQQSESGGLTVDNSSAENHCTIFSVAEHPNQSQIIWVGTDDGNIAVTTNDGGSWQQCTYTTSSIRRGWVTSVEPVANDTKTCFATIDRHMDGDMEPYVIVTRDGGTSWQRLPTDGVVGYAHVVRVDSREPRVIWLGTELGLWLSLDGGASWARFKNGIPPVAVRDIVLHPRDHDVVVATHGRGIYVIDDADILRALPQITASQDLVVLGTTEGVRRTGGLGSWFAGDGEFVGDGKDRSAKVWYYLKERHMRGKFVVRLRDSDGNVIRTFPATGRKGLNAVVIPLRRPAPVTARSEVAFARGAFVGPLLAEASYTVELDRAGTLESVPLRVRTDSTYTYSAEDLRKQTKLVERLFDLNEELAVTATRIQTLGDTVRRRLRELPSTALAVRPALEHFLDSVLAANADIVNTKRGMISGERQLREELAETYGDVNATLAAPTDQQETLTNDLERRVTFATERVERVLSRDLELVNQQLRSGGLAHIEVEPRQKTMDRLLRR